MSKHPKLRPKSCIAGYPDAVYDFSAASSLTHFESRTATNDEKHDQRIFRVKRKHVLKACDRCRVKKTKCDGKQPCNRCSSYNHPCLFRERKATQTKVYSRGFVEMLESHHSLVVKALQRLYKICASKEGFPGDPLAETSDGYPLTHAILDRLGLIQQAENAPQAAGKETEDLQYLRVLSSSAECSATSDPSPEPATPSDPAPILTSPVQSSPDGQGPLKWRVQTIQAETYDGYPQGEIRGMAPQPAPDISNLVSESKCTATACPSVTGLATSYVYFVDGSCNQETTDNHLQSAVTSGSSVLPTATSTGLPVNLVETYSLPVHDHQSVYPTPLTPGWGYPCE